jgi:peptide/nickel transport system ATP-binding protein
LINVPNGCPFHPRCTYADLTAGASQTELPELLEISPRHFLACHLSEQDRQRVWENEIKPSL